MERKIPVVLSTDENYIFPTFVVISSMLQYAHEETVYDIYIQTLETCRKKCLEMTQYLHRSYQNFKLYLLIMDQALFERVKVTNVHVKSPTYYRLLAAEQLPQCDRCVILDSDILVQDDLTELYQWEIGDNYVAGVRSWEDQQPTQTNHEHMVSIGLPSMDSYIYSGVLLLNLRQIREDNITDRFMAHMRKGYTSDDQDVFNVCCYGNISFLPLRYNLLVRHYKEKFPEGVQIYSNKEINDASEYPAILHYPGRLIKPWKNNKVKLGREWWKCAKIFEETVEYNTFKADMDKWTGQLGVGYIENNIPAGSRIVLFGFSNIGKKVCAELLETKKYKIIGFSDNDKNKHGLMYEQFHVIDIDAVTNTREAAEYYFVITSQRSAEEIKEQLMEKGIRENRIFIYTNLNQKYCRSIEN